MTTHGLIPDEWLVSYAAGALSEPEALLVASHIEMQPSLQNRLAVAESVGGALMETLEPTPLAGDAIEQTMARIDAESQELPAPDAGHWDPDLPPVLRRLLGRPIEDMRWKTMGPGMKQCRLLDGPGGQRLWLLKARGGTKIPVHDHRGNEYTLVLRGSYHVGDSRYTPGLMEFADPSVTSHQPIIDDGETCICLVVTDANIRLHSLIGKLVQPFIGL